MLEDIDSSLEFDNSSSSTELYSKAKNSALRLLARREYTKFELSTKLSAKQYSADIIEQVLKYLTDNNFQSDYRAAEMFLSHGYKQGWGPNKIRMQMQTKGLVSSIIEQTFADRNDNILAQSSLDQDSLELNNPNDKQAALDKLQQLIDSSTTASIASGTSASIYQESFNHRPYYDFYKSAREQAVKKFGLQILNQLYKNSSDWALKSKVQKYLYNKGFEQDQIEYACVYSEDLDS